MAAATQPKIWDVAIVGAGAAGLFTAILAARENISVILLDRRDRFGAKIIMSGGTRCNLTNARVSDTDFASESPHFVRSILKAFTPTEAVARFNEMGIHVEQEEGGKYFPTTHSSQTVLDALTQEALKRGVIIKTPVCVERVTRENEVFALSGTDFDCHARAVVLTTGGLSFPTTGSTGIGYAIAERFGHHLVFTSASLTPFLSSDSDFQSLSGLSSEVALTFFEQAKKKKTFRGSFLFTHFGFSGPVALDISRYWIRSNDQKKRQVFANFCPNSTPEMFRKELVRDAKTSKLTLNNYISERLPARLATVLLKKSGISPSERLYRLTKENREVLLHNIFACPLLLTGDKGYEKAEVTAGGVSLKEIRKQDMQSRLVPGLFFAGEICDVDGRIGGFNFQWSWSSAAVSARGLIQYLQ